MWGVLLEEGKTFLDEAHTLLNRIDIHFSDIYLKRREDSVYSAVNIWDSNILEFNITPL